MKCNLLSCSAALAVLIPIVFMVYLGMYMVGVYLISMFY